MAATLLFVHGTGVRAERFTKTLGLLERGVEEAGLGVVVEGCYWGQTEGARLHADGRSIPTYADTGGQGPTDHEQNLALWFLLYTDPWYELRALRHKPGPGAMPPGAEPPASVLRRQVEEFEPDAPLRQALEAAGISDAFAAALDALRGAPELDQAAKTADLQPMEHRGAIARALAACALTAAEDAGDPPLDGASRDALVALITDQLEGHALGVGSFLKGQISGIAARIGTRKLTSDRGAITDDTAPMAGDVLRFLARGDGMRDYLRAAINDHAGDGVILLGHSLGGIMCVDLLARGSVAGVEGLITVGSQAPFLYEIDALPALAHPDPLPEHFPAWTNIYDPRDILSYLGAGIFGPRVTDVCVDNTEPFPRAHSAYWTNAAVWNAIAKAIT